MEDLRLILSFNESRNDSIYLESKLVAENLNIGKFLDINEISGPVSFSADVEIMGNNLDDLAYSFQIND